MEICLKNFVFSCEPNQKIDINDYHRELGQLFILAIQNDTAESPIKQSIKSLKTNIPECLKLIVQAGVSIEVVDGDTTNMNQEIIIEVLELLKRT